MTISQTAISQGVRPCRRRAATTTFRTAAPATAENNPLTISAPVSSVRCTVQAGPYRISHGRPSSSVIPLNSVITTRRLSDSRALVARKASARTSETSGMRKGVRVRNLHHSREAHGILERRLVAPIMQQAPPACQARAHVDLHRSDTEPRGGEEEERRRGQLETRGRRSIAERRHLSVTGESGPRACPPW